MPAETKPAKGDPPGPYLLVATSAGYTLRTPLAPFRVASTKAGRRYARLGEGDKVVMATVLGQTKWTEEARHVVHEESMFLASADGHVIHFRDRRGERPVRRRQGRDRHQARQGRRVHRRGPGVEPVHEDGRGDVRRPVRELGGGKPTVGRGGWGTRR